MYQTVDNPSLNGFLMGSAAAEMVKRNKSKQITLDRLQEVIYNLVLEDESKLKNFQKCSLDILYHICQNNYKKCKNLKVFEQKYLNYDNLKSLDKLKQYTDEEIYNSIVEIKTLLTYTKPTEV
ncbi:MAG: hypothetical protein Q4E88_02275 [Coriobacteriia bacterium]|nr:hypothetical protein [Coriobacteriia bacterium]